MSRRGGAAIRFAFGLALLAWLLARTDAGALRRTLAAADPGWLVLAFAIQVGSKSFGVLRWRTLLGALGQRVSRRRLLRLVMVGLFFNQILPSSVGGDVARGLGLAERSIPRATAAASVVGDRVVGVLALAFLAALGGVYGAAAYPGQGPWTVAIAFAALVGLLLAALGRPAILRRAARIPGVPAGIARKLGRLTESLVLLAGRRDRVAVAWAFSLGLATCAAAFHWSVGRAVAIDVPFVAYLVIVPTVMLFATAPITLNGLGVRELGWVAFLGAQGVSRPEAAAFAALALAIPLLFALTGGLLFLAGGRRAGVAPGKEPSAGGT